MDSKQLLKQMDAAWLEIQVEMQEIKKQYGDNIPLAVVSALTEKMRSFRRQYGSNSEASKQAYPFFSKYMVPKAS
ncbi:MAG: hypothetical protein QM731_26570 [Chitinophagaceae bacterium]